MFNAQRTCPGQELSVGAGAIADRGERVPIFVVEIEKENHAVRLDGTGHDLAAEKDQWTFNQAQP